MKICSPTMMKNTGHLHILALIVAIYGTSMQIDDVKQGKGTSAKLAIALTVMLVLRIPNQICVALQQKHGWYSVVGTVIGAGSFAYLAYMENNLDKEGKKEEKTNKKHHMMM